jgi:putative membrane protein
MLTLAACGHDAPPPVIAAPPPPPPAEAAPPPAAPVSADQQFLDQAATGGTAEVEAGKLARQQAQSRAVKAFGARMVRDHGSANARLMALAKKLNMTPNAAPADTSQLAGASGADFDKAYMANQVQAHQDAIAAFEAEAGNGQNAQLKRFAKSSLPMLRSHLKQAEALAHKLGG